MKTYRRLGKPVLDYICSLVLLCLLTPLNIAISLAILISMGSPILFCQERIGYKSKLFKIYKFRTMNDARDCNGNILPDEYRLTKIGLFLRRFGLDELPELFNVLKGDLSLVGPRPLLPKYLPYFSRKELKRFDVRPGISGLAQVYGRNDISWEKRFEYDIYYVENYSFLLDLKIIVLTILVIITGAGFQNHPEKFMMNLDEERRLSEKTTHDIV